jgi:tRNA(fMet)-specific endonuclease VapC
MERVLLDTDVFSEALRARSPAIRAKSDAYLDVFGCFTLSVITVSELIDGFRRQQRGDRITALMAEIMAVKHEVLELDLKAAEIAGCIFGDLHRTGKSIGRSDPFIAAIALREGIPLVTGNIEHFERIRALGYPLSLENWRGG